MRGAGTRLFGVAAAAWALSACSEDPDPFVIAVRGPLGGKAFDGTPAVTQVELRVRASDGVERLVSKVPASEGSLEVPDSAKSGIGALTLAGLADDGAIVAYGRTPPLELSGLAGQPTLALTIFVQRVREIAPMVALTAAPAKPLCAALGGRYLVVADASSTNADVVDLLDLTALREAPFTTAPATLATAGARMLALDAAGSATLLDVAQSAQGTPTPPAGATFAEVAGGATVLDDTGGAWIVGPTRVAPPSDLVLRLDPTGTLVARRLTRARSAAAATWVPGRGLVIAYGLAPSGDPPGVEVVAPGASVGAPLPFAGDGQPGGVLVPLDGARLLRIGEDGKGTLLDLACARDCVPSATAIADEPRATRSDDHVTVVEGGALIARGGRLSLLSADGTRLDLLRDVGATSVCSAALSTGGAGLSIAGSPLAHAVLAARP
ncbi:MAG: hypothetical protein HYV09_20310 [Deltaproteobacteria bacterium]|nr:hypothetical protein [Deltaproteobacteria bacterium]